MSGIPVVTRDRLVATAAATLDICDRGVFEHDGKEVWLETMLAKALQDTILLQPDDGVARNDPRQFLMPEGDPAGGPPTITVTADTTVMAAHQTQPWYRRVGILNFASAKHPGGGFLRGAMAQEEELCRTSGLYPCLVQERCRPFYAKHKLERDPLYSDTMIYSPGVPFFRASGASPPGQGLPSEATPGLFLADVVTSPAPNAGELQTAVQRGRLASVLAHRTRLIVCLFANMGCRHLVLGAWGCGVFKNDAHEVAYAFRSALGDPRFYGYFDEVVFACPGSFGLSLQNRQAFEEVFAEPLTKASFQVHARPPQATTPELSFTTSKGAKLTVRQAGDHFEIETPAGWYPRALGRTAQTLIVGVRSRATDKDEP